MIFFILSILIFIFSFLLINNYSNPKIYRIEKYIFWIFTIIIIFLVGLKGSNDEYTKFYLTVPYFGQIFLDGLNVLKTNYSVNSYGYEKEIIFLIILSFLKSLTLGPQSIYIVFGSLSFFINSFFISKFTRFILFTLLIYVSHHLIFRELSGVRLGAASSLLLPAIYFLSKKKYIYSIIICLLSSQIHSVGYFSLLIFLSNLKIKETYIIIMITITLIISYLKIPYILLEFLLSLNLFPSRVEAYFLSGEKERYAVYSKYISFNPKLIQQILITFIFCYLSIKYKNLFVNSYFLILKNIYYFSTIMFIALSFSPIISVRINAHFMIVESILISCMLYYIYNKKLFLFISGILLVLICYFNYIFFNRVDDYIFLLRDNYSLIGQ